MSSAARLREISLLVVILVGCASRPSAAAISMQGGRLEGVDVAPVRAGHLVGPSMRTAGTGPDPRCRDDAR